MNIQPGGSLLVSWQIKGKSALVVGAGDVAQGRVKSLLDAGAVVTVVAPDLSNADLKKYIESKPEDLVYVKAVVEVPTDDKDPEQNANNNTTQQAEPNKEEPIDSTDLSTTLQSLSIHHTLTPKQLLLEAGTPKYAMVLTAINTPGVSEAIHAVCKQAGIPVNVADVPPLCDFYFASAIRRGPLQVAVSTNGQAPRLARNIRADIERSIDSLGNIELAIDKVALLRTKLKAYTDAHPELHATQQEKIRTRMKWMSAVCDNWSYEDLAALEPQLMDRLIQKYPSPALS